jgi:hypothetical protein
LVGREGREGFCSGFLRRSRRDTDLWKGEHGVFYLNYSLRESDGVGLDERKGEATSTSRLEDEESRSLTVCYSDENTEKNNKMKTHSEERGAKGCEVVVVRS